jgi:hypothetical protein
MGMNVSFLFPLSLWMSEIKQQLPPVRLRRCGGMTRPPVERRITAADAGLAGTDAMSETLRIMRNVIS